MDGPGNCGSFCWQLRGGFMGQVIRDLRIIWGGGWTPADCSPPKIFWIRFCNKQIRGHSPILISSVLWGPQMMEPFHFSPRRPGSCSHFDFSLRRHGLCSHFNFPCNGKGYTAISNSHFSPPWPIDYLTLCQISNVFEAWLEPLECRSRPMTLFIGEGLLFGDGH